ncbi:hypothetical protein [Kaarinaea lacus]
MSGVPNQRFGPVESCVDYQSYVYTIDPNLTPEQFAASRELLINLGNADKERMGVVYVRGPWGFFVIPHFGYPTLRVSFYHDTPAIEIDKMLSSIAAAFETSNTINNQGGLDE